MKVGQISSYNLSFGEKAEKNEETVKKESEHLKWVSHNQANNALFLIKGREVRNAKFELADTALTLGGLASGIAGGLLLLSEKLKAGRAFIVAAFSALFLTQFVQMANRSDAMSTADERGFTKGSANLYRRADSTQEAHREAKRVYEANTGQLTDEED